ncbi:twin-arginine translocation signal domain-containing protein [Natronosporangium hydrolyticum]|uniref:Twin-arginine translocation signal domain-containing protein n=1 Tax=Natronosporangium hydrolyticum TaxID=2811111 RepID=A0A895YCQ9_9ACTN|nr:ABC transporter substrate-binding protein [Natronosporangium hydrolyticum]QSB13972.1 twin-arginine translocation signal domain-containing protein [Natronosporangium hydrolyticum]
MLPMNRRTFLRGSALAAGAGALSLTACGGQEQSGTDPQPLTLRMPGPDVAFPSPFTYRGGIGYLQASYLYDTLLWKDAAGEYIPWLATGFERSDDGRTYTFTLREGVTWHDGEPLTAEDVAFTFDYLAEHADQLAPSVITVPNYDNLAGVEAIDELTVEFRLREPDWTFEQFTGAGGVLIFPRHIWSSISEPGQQQDPALLVGSGPYRLTEYEPGTGANLYLANDDYFLGQPAVARIEHRPVDDPLAALLAGEVDQAGGVGPGTGLRPQALAPFEDRDEFEVIDAPFGETVVGLYWNLAAGGVLAEASFRRACALAIDRQMLVERLFDGKAAPGNPGLLPPSHPYHVPVEQYEHDPAQAEQLLADAGYERDGADGIRRGPDGEPLRFELLVSNEQPMGPVELVIAELAEIGIECEPVAVDLPSFHERLNSGQTELSMTTFGGTNTDEQPDGMAKVYASTSRSLQRAQGYANAEFDRLAEQQRATLDESERQELAAQMQQLVAEELPMLPLVYPPLTTIVRTTEFDAWYLTPGGVGGLVPGVNNKHAFVTGATTGGVS